MQNGEKIKLNATDITTFRYCPRQYYYSRVEKRESPPNEHLVRGTLVHSLYQEFFKRKLFEAAEKDPSYYEWFLTTGIDRMMEKENGRINKLGMNHPTLKRFLIAAVHRLLESFKAGTIKEPSLMEHKVENEDFVARIDTIFEKEDGLAIGDVKIKLRELESVKLQLAVAAIILESMGKKVEKGLAISAEDWKEIEFPLEDSLKEEVMDIRSKILQMHETKEKPACVCGRCDLQFNVF